MDAYSPIPSVPGVPFPASQVSAQVPADSHQFSPNRHWLPAAPYAGSPRLHPWELPTLVLIIVVGLFGYGFIVLMVLLGGLSPVFLGALLLPLLLFLGRAINYATMRVNGVQMTPTQFPEGYQMVVEAAARYGLEYVPDAYVVSGNGSINAFASGHGFRRFVVVFSDLFEIGGQARSPEALKFIIGHEVGHIAAGHTSYWRQLTTAIGSQIPLVGTTLSRAQEYSADNHGYFNQPSGAPGAIGVLAAGKYMLSAVNFDEFADRATHERGPFVHVVNATSTHPVLTWRAAALRNRTRSGAILLRPKQFVRGTGSGNVVPISPPHHPVKVAPGSLPNGLSDPPRF